MTHKSEEVAGENIRGLSFVLSFLAGWLPCNTSDVECHILCMTCFGLMVICGYRAAQGYAVPRGGGRCEGPRGTPETPYSGP